MNVKNSRCMNRLRYIFAACLLAGCCLALSAQTFESVYRRNVWNDSRNAAGIRQDSLSLSCAELYGRYEGGGFRDTWQAPQGWSAGAVTRNIRHFEKISFAGSFSFDQNEMYGTCGSMFIDPGYFPIDVLEFTPGRKTLQAYAFEGRVSYDAGKNLTIGAAMDFESENMAKKKDLRHTNWRLDMTVAPGIVYRAGDVSIGAAAVFSKTAESVEAEQVGTAESSYLAFLDKGLMYGVCSVWTGSGVHLDESGVKSLPVSEYLYGPSLQFQYRNLYLDAEVLGNSGKVGEKEYIWFDYSGIRTAARIRYRLAGEMSEHRFGLDFDLQTQDVDENVLEKVSENGVSTVIMHGSNRMYSRNIWGISPKYEYLSEIVEVRASASLGWNNGIASQIYPYVFARSLMTASVTSDVLLHLGGFDLGARLGYMEGSVRESMRTSSQGQLPQSEPYRLQDWYERHTEYMTAPRVSAGISLRYDFSIGIYLEASGEWMHGFGISTLSGQDRAGATMKIGYAF